MAAREEIPEEMPMDMSVSVAPEKQAVAGEAKSDQIVRSPNSSDLDEWLAKVDAMGELKRCLRRMYGNMKSRQTSLATAAQ
jgi:hypothetical protein